MKDKSKLIHEDTEKWEKRELGADENFVEVVDQKTEGEVNNSLGLHPISVRLQKQLIADLKLLADKDGIGYQPLIRQILSRYVLKQNEEAQSPLSAHG